MPRDKKLPGTPSEADIDRMVQEFGAESVLCHLLISGWDLQRRASIAESGTRRQWLFTAAWYFAQARALEEKYHV